MISGYCTGDVEAHNQRFFASLRMTALVSRQLFQSLPLLLPSFRSRPISFMGDIRAIRG
jgi:hypothetical protein